MNRRARRTRALHALVLGVVLGALPMAAAASEGGVVRLRVNGISCPFCAYGIEKKLGGLESVASVEVRLDEGAVIVRTHPSTILTEEQARAAVEAAGFSLEGFAVLSPAEGSGPNKGAKAPDPSVPGN